MAISGDDGSIILGTKVDTKGLNQGLNSIQGTVKKVGKALAAAFAIKKIYDFGKAVVSAYAEFEQLAGGVEKIFDQANIAQIVEDANNAFLDLNMSANDYLRTINDIGATFSATMGDQKGYDTARQGLLAISDYASGTGKNIDVLSEKFTMITRSASSYQSIADQFSGILPATSADFLAQAKAAGFLSNQYTKLTEVPIAEYQQAVTKMLSKGVAELGLTGNTAMEAATTISGSLAMTKSAWQNLLTAMAGGGDLDRAINNFVYSLEKFTANIVPVIERTLMGLGQAVQRTLPMLVQTVVSALVQQIPNLVMAVYNMIVGLFKGIVLGIKALFTGGTAKATEVIKSNVETGAENTEQMAENMERTAEETKKAGKEAKKSLAAFDELNILSSGASGGTDAGETPEATMPTISAGGGGGLLQDMSVIKQEIDAQLQAIMGVAGGALLAIGLLLLFSGNIIWGISFIIAGAVTVGVALQTLSQQDVVNPINEKLMKILAIAGTALVALGLILLFSGVWKWGIAFLVAGAATLGVAIVATTSGKVDKEAEKMLINIMTIAGAAMLALGVILLCFGVVSPLSIGLVVAGAASLAGAIALNPQLVFESVSKFLTDNAGLIVGISLALLVLGIVLCVCGVVTPLSIGMIVVGATGLVAEVALNWNYVTEQVTKFFKDNSALIVGVSLALLVIGIILCFTGVGIPLAIGLIVVGAAGLATEAVLNWNYITEKVTQFFRDNAGLIVGVSIALIVLGIILLFTGVGIPLAIGLIVAGGGALAATVALNWNFIVDKVKEVWGKVKQFWNENIAPVFTAEWWLNLGETVMNGLIAGFEAGINGIIGMFEKMINWIVNGLNKISFDVPDWVPGIGGKTFGFNIPKVEFGRVSIPRLAQGAVIPPNREFLAVLGDQKHGTNIEAPADLIKQKVMEAMIEMGGNFGGGNTEVVLEIDGREFGRAVVEQGNRENRRIGTRLVIA